MKQRKDVFASKVLKDVTDQLDPLKRAGRTIDKMVWEAEQALRNLKKLKGLERRNENESHYKNAVFELEQIIAWAENPIPCCRVCGGAVDRPGNIHDLCDRT